MHFKLSSEAPPRFAFPFLSPRIPVFAAATSDPDNGRGEFLAVPVQPRYPETER